MTDCLWLVQKFGQDGHDAIQKHWPGVNAETKRDVFHVGAGHPHPMRVLKPVRMEWSANPSPTAPPMEYWMVTPERFGTGTRRVVVMGYLPDTNTIYMWEY